MLHPPRLYTLREVAVVARVSLATVRYWVNTGRLASVRPAKHRLVEAGILGTFLSQRNKTNKPEQQP